MLDKTVEEFIGAAQVPRVKLTDTVEHALNVMVTTAVDAVVVVRGGEPVGVFTERDLMNRVIALRQPLETRISEVMTPDPVTLRPHDSIAFAVNRMAMGGFRTVPVVDEGGMATAVITARDVVSHLHELFEALDDDLAERPEWDAWEDIGGGD